MAISTTRFNLLFGVSGINSLTRTRSTLRSLQDQTYISTNAMSRSFSALDRSLGRSGAGMERSLGRINRMMSAFRGGFVLGGMMLGMNMWIGSLRSLVNSVDNAFVKTNASIITSKIMLEELLGSKSGADGFINSMQNLSSTFGQDIKETMVSARGLMQVMKQIDTPQPKHLEKLMKMVMAVSALDLENRGLSYTAFSFKEAFSGQGSIDFRSLRNRLEINLGKATEQAITKAVKEKNLDKALNLLDAGLSRIGINSSKLLNRLIKDGLDQNINMIKRGYSRVFQIIGEDFSKSLVRPLANFNVFLSRQFKDGSVGMNYLKNFGKRVKELLSPIAGVGSSFGSMMYKSRFALTEGIIDLGTSGLEAFLGLNSAFMMFMRGLLGVEKRLSNVNGMIQMFKKLKEVFQGITKFANDMKTPLYDLGQSINNLVSSIAKLIGGASGGNGGNVMANIMGAFTTAFNTAAVPFNSANQMSQGEPSKIPFTNMNMPQMDTILMALMAIPMIKGLFVGRTALRGLAGRTMVGGTSATAIAGVSGAGATTAGVAGNANNFATATRARMMAANMSRKEDIQKGIDFLKWQNKMVSERFNSRFARPTNRNIKELKAESIATHGIINRNNKIIQQREAELKLIETRSKVLNSGVKPLLSAENIGMAANVGMVGMAASSMLPAGTLATAMPTLAGWLPPTLIAGGVYLITKEIQKKLVEMFPDKSWVQKYFDWDGTLQIQNAEMSIEQSTQNVKTLQTQKDKTIIGQWGADPSQIKRLFDMVGTNQSKFELFMAKSLNQPSRDVLMNMSRDLNAGLISPETVDRYVDEAGASELISKLASGGLNVNAQGTITVNGVTDAVVTKLARALSEKIKMDMKGAISGDAELTMDSATWIENVEATLGNTTSNNGNQ